jgi:hypothetical protein
MACRLYRQGTTHVVRGIPCELQKFEAHEVPVQLLNGWFTSPQAAYEEVTDGLQEEKEKHEEITEKEEVIETIVDYDSLPTGELRLIAKDACIDNWKKARRQTLLNKLKEV